MSESPPFTASYRPRRYVLHIGVGAVFSILILGIALSDIALRQLHDANPQTIAMIIAAYGLLAFMAIVTGYLILAWQRKTLILSPTNVFQRGVSTTRTLPRADMATIIWRTWPTVGGSIVARTRTASVTVELDIYTGAEQQQIISYFRNTFPTASHNGQARFVAWRDRGTDSWGDINIPTPVFVIACTLLSAFAAAVIWFGATGAGVHLLALGVASLAGLAWYVWRGHKYTSNADNPNDRGPIS